MYTIFSNLSLCQKTLLHQHSLLNKKKKKFNIKCDIQKLITKNCKLKFEKVLKNYLYKEDPPPYSDPFETKQTIKKQTSTGTM